jgi:hypothetical protein
MFFSWLPGFNKAVEAEVLAIKDDLLVNAARDRAVLAADVRTAVAALTPVAETAAADVLAAAKAAVEAALASHGL